MSFVAVGTWGTANAVPIGMAALGAGAGWVSSGGGRKKAGGGGKPHQEGRRALGQQLILFKGD